MAYPGAYPPAGGYGQPQQGYPPQGGYGYGYAQSSPAPAQPKQTQSAVMDQQAQAMQMAELRRQFDSVDKNKTGNITANELMNISFSGTKLSLETSRKLVKLFDRHGLAFQEYAPLHKFVITTQAAFMQADTMRTNRLDENALQRGLSIAGFNFGPQMTSQLFRKVGGNANFENFLQLCALLGRLRATFDSLDAQKQGAVHLNMEQLVNIAVHV